MSSIYDSYPLDKRIPGFFNGFDTRREMEEANENATERLLADMKQSFNRRIESAKTGVPALKRLVSIAQGDHGQAKHIRRFLLALYNGFEWPLDMRRLRCLDPDLQQAVLAVIQLDWCGREIHTYLEGGDELFHKFWQLETPVMEDDID